MENTGNNITVIVETPKGCGHKYNYDAANDQFRLKKLLPAGMVFPFDFGFIPNTIGGDGDPLDVLVISEVSTFPGCVIDCRLIGAFKVEQTGADGTAYRNDRFLAVPLVSKFFTDLHDAAQLPHALTDQIEAFFTNYSRLEAKEFKLMERLGAEGAMELVMVATVKPE
ncbi:inorganic pyrophosphatase [Mucilaginibacter oryzae]|uniref:inorganic diphosphatase n=1 Tax=Mucilaginibacter oryzae TaxID=468058 RepID=A0A316HHX7_9SPHI|nr:inorganic diphosphatase [Mucilaginibacter oryzae]PWK79590.1 inorganic pyrophosphatase [Mucilaginibacter oryzae]